MYVVPAGENPTGTTMTAARKQEIYDICVEYDIIIVEDDPYFFLREGPYIPKDDRSFSDASGNEDNAAFISSLGPTFLRYDYQGRVIRLDTFSKTIAPGCRLGWFTCNPLFSDCLARLSEKASNAPCGISQSLVAKLLLTWKHEGYVRWLHGLSKQYTMRRDAFFDYLFEEFFITRTHCKGDGRDLYSAFAKKSTISGHERDEGCSKVLFSFIPPTSGMFIWIRVHSENRPSLESDKTPEQELWFNLAEADLLLAPGSIFSPDLVGDANQVHFRISFSNSTFDEMKKAVSIFGRVLCEYFGVKE
jgi:aromatic amino acid aminotransferase I